MFRLTQRDLEFIEQARTERLPIGKRFATRSRFLIPVDANGMPRHDPAIRSVQGMEPGLIHPRDSWDTLPPVALNRQQVEREGIEWIHALVPDPDFTVMTRTLWSAVEGGRALVTPDDARAWPMDRRVVEYGQLDNALFQGREDDRIRVTRSLFRNCLFWACTFTRTDFIETSFHGSNFAACVFNDCRVISCQFDNTTWGDPRFFPQSGPRGEGGLDYYNQMRMVRPEGELSFAGARGYGPALFMTPAQQAHRLKEAAAMVQSSTLDVWTEERSA